jgi:YHS domain-containing protein
MTSARPQRKPRVTLAVARGRDLARRLCLAGLLVVATPFPPPLGAATTERVVSDPHTGLAINGVDPVAYFTDGAALFGRAEYEYRYAGVIWRFCNEGNQAAFIANPQVYMPRFGGYDPVAIGRSLAVPGNPLLWAMVGERLYLFYNEAARTRFIATPDEAIPAADSKWPAVVSGLVP